MTPSLPHRLALPGIAAFSAGVCGGGWWGLLAIAFGLIVLVLLCREPSGEFRLIGPFAWRELVRAGRGSKRQFWRSIYVLIAFLGLVLFHLNSGVNGQGVFSVQTLRHMTETNEHFFYLYSAVLLIITSILTMNWASELITEERHAKRWDILRTTQLTSREIVLGKAIGRLPVIFDPFVATLPVLAMMTMIGGFSPLMLGITVLATIITAFGLGGLTLFYATFAMKAGQASGSATGIAFLYLVVSGFLSIIGYSPKIALFPTTYWPSCPFAVADLVRILQSGNPFVLMNHAGWTLDEACLAEIPRYAAFHLFVGLLFGSVAILRLRTAVPWDTVTAAKVVLDRVARKPGWSSQRPPVTDYPITWWEQFGQLNAVQLATWQSTSSWKLLWFVGTFVTMGLFVHGICIVTKADWKQTAAPIVGFCCWIFCWPPIMGAMFRGAKSIARERAGDTLDMLLTTDLTTNDILYQKWRGVVTAERPAVTIGLTMLVAAIITGFVPILGAIALVLSSIVFTMACGAVGLAVSVHAPKPESAVRRLLFVMVPASVCGAMFVWPPFLAGMIFALSFRSEGNPGSYGFMALVGMGVWAVIGLVAWNIAKKQLASVRSIPKSTE